MGSAVNWIVNRGLWQHYLWDGVKFSEEIRCNVTLAMKMEKSASKPRVRTKKQQAIPEIINFAGQQFCSTKKVKKTIPYSWFVMSVIWDCLCTSLVVSISTCSCKLVTIAQSQYIINRHTPTAEESKCKQQVSGNKNIVWDCESG